MEIELGQLLVRVASGHHDGWESLQKACPDGSNCSGNSLPDERLTDSSTQKPGRLTNSQHCPWIPKGLLLQATVKEGQDGVVTVYAMGHT